MAITKRLQHLEAIAAEHLRIQASLTRCHDCQDYFRDIDDHVRKTVTVKAVEIGPDDCLEQVRNGYSDAV